MWIEFYLESTTNFCLISGTSFDITGPSPFAGYTVFYGSVTPGFHTVVSSSPSDNFTVFVYGSAPASSPSGNTGYGYLAGYRYDMSEFETLVLRYSLIDTFTFVYKYKPL